MTKANEVRQVKEVKRSHVAPVALFSVILDFPQGLRPLVFQKEQICIFSNNFSWRHLSPFPWNHPLGRRDSWAQDHHWCHGSLAAGGRSYTAQDAKHEVSEEHRKPARHHDALVGSAAPCSSRCVRSLVLSSLPKSRDMVDCGLLRHLAAFLILLVWTKLSLVVSNHPAFPCDRYVPMLAKVFLIPSIGWIFRFKGAPNLDSSHGVLFAVHWRVLNGFLHHSAAGGIVF